MTATPKTWYLSIALFLFASIISYFLFGDVLSSPSQTLQTKINGVSYVAPSRKPSVDPFKPIQAIHANWVAVMPYAYGKANMAFIRYDDERQWWGERTEGTIATIQQIQKKGLKVMLKPHVWVMGEGWGGDFKVNTEEDWKAWEQDYENYILHFAQIADTMQVPLFCIGLEFRQVVKERPDFWKHLIKSVKKVYSGELVYAANWDNFEQVSFWEDLDYIGIDAYFPLSQKDTPSTMELKLAWKQPFETLKNLQEKYKKPILFTEYGYRSINKAAGKQWELPDDWHYQGNANLQVQVNAYEALFETFWDEPWFAGGFLWKWYHKPNAGGTNHSGYTPQNKPVETVIQTQYSNQD